MNLNSSTVSGKWKEIRGEVQKAWGNLTDDELDKTKGDMKIIGGLIQQRYGHAKNDYEKKLSDIFKKFEKKTDEGVDKLKSSLKIKEKE